MDVWGAVQRSVGTAAWHHHGDRSNQKVHELLNAKDPYKSK